MSTQTAVDQKSTRSTPGNGSGPAPEPTAGSPAVGQDGEPVIVQRLKSERVQEGLKTMTGWALAHEDEAIECVKVYPTPEVAAFYAAFVGRFASAAGFFVTVSLAGGQVRVTVYAPQITGCRGEVDLPVLAFARQL